MVTDVAGEFGRRVGGRLCLDFTNTVAAWLPCDGDGAGRDWKDCLQGERLGSWGALVRWAQFAGAVTAAQAAGLLEQGEARAGEAAEVLRRAVRLRHALYRTFRAVMEGWSPEAADIATLDREVRAARSRQRLTTEPEIGWEWEEDARALDRVLWAVALSAAELLTDDARTRVHQCPGADCGWLFLDTSRSGRRRWCDMADCGNVAKVRRYRRRNAGADQ